MEKYCKGEVTSIGEAKVRQEQSEIEKKLEFLTNTLRSNKRIAIRIRNQVFSPIPSGSEGNDKKECEKTLCQLFEELTEFVDETNEILDETANALRVQLGNIRLI